MNSTAQEFGTVTIESTSFGNVTNDSTGFENITNEGKGILNATGDGTDYTSLIEYQAGTIIWKVISPVMIVLGTIGNILTIMVLCRKSVRNNSSAVYLSMLAISDSLSLYSGLLRQWIIYTFDTDVRTYGPFICKLHLFLVYFSLDFSAWLLVAVTFDRVFKTIFPFVAKTKCTRKNAAILISVLAMVLAFLNSHLFYGMGQVISENKDSVTTVDHCAYITEEYKSFFDNVWPWVDLAVYCLLPFVLLLIGNIIIITKLFKSFKDSHVKVGPQLEMPKHQHEEQTKQGNQEEKRAANTEIPACTLEPATPTDPQPGGSNTILRPRSPVVSCIEADPKSTTHENIFVFPNSLNPERSPTDITGSNTSSNIISDAPSRFLTTHGENDEPSETNNRLPKTNRKQTPKKRISSTTCTLFALNTVFLLSTTPVSIYLIGYTHWAQDASEQKMAVLELMWAFVNILMYTNNTVNFFLYCLSGSRFRNELKNIFKFK